MNESIGQEPTEEKLLKQEQSNNDFNKQVVDTMSLENINDTRALLQKAVNEGKKLSDMINTLRMSGNDFMADVAERMLNEEKGETNIEIPSIETVEDPSVIEAQTEAVKNKETKRQEDIEALRTNLGISAPTENPEE